MWGPSKLSRLGDPIIGTCSLVNISRKVGNGVLRKLPTKSPPDSKLTDCMQGDRGGWQQAHPVRIRRVGFVRSTLRRWLHRAANVQDRQEHDQRPREHPRRRTLQRTAAQWATLKHGENKAHTAHFGFFSPCKDEYFRKRTSNSSSAWSKLSFGHSTTSVVSTCRFDLI